MIQRWEGLGESMRVVAGQFGVSEVLMMDRAGMFSLVETARRGRLCLCVCEEAHAWHSKRGSVKRVC